eukprot:3108021-Karenia_brevis.AAC.1
MGQRSAAYQVGVAAKDGEMEKLARYGSPVMPLAFETYGRLGIQSQQQLRNLAEGVPSHFNHASGYSGSSLYACWRLELERTLTREIAD